MQGENTSNDFSNILGLGANALMNYLGNKVIVLDEKHNGDSSTQNDYPLYAIKIEEIE